MVESFAGSSRSMLDELKSLQCLFKVCSTSMIVSSVMPKASRAKSHELLISYPQLLSAMFSRSMKNCVLIFSTKASTVSSGEAWTILISSRGLKRMVSANIFVSDQIY